MNENNAAIKLLRKEVIRLEKKIRNLNYHHKKNYISLYHQATRDAMIFASKNDMAVTKNIDKFTKLSKAVDALEKNVKIELSNNNFLSQKIKCERDFSQINSAIYSLGGGFMSASQENRLYGKPEIN